jgi:hypothetical protein
MEWMEHVNTHAGDELQGASMWLACVQLATGRNGRIEPLNEEEDEEWARK